MVVAQRVLRIEIYSVDLSWNILDTWIILNVSEVF